jgi:hypothetical protein
VGGTSVGGTAVGGAGVVVGRFSVPALAAVVWLSNVICRRIGLKIATTVSSSTVAIAVPIQMIRLGFISRFSRCLNEGTHDREWIPFGNQQSAFSFQLSLSDLGMSSLGSASSLLTADG